MSGTDPVQPNKPDGAVDADGEARPVAERQAVRNQGEVTPDDYLPGSDGKPPHPRPD